MRDDVTNRRRMDADARPTASQANLTEIVFLANIRKIDAMSESLETESWELFNTVT